MPMQKYFDITLLVMGRRCFMLRPAIWIDNFEDGLENGMEVEEPIIRKSVFPCQILQCVTGSASSISSLSSAQFPPHTYPPLQSFC
jgi:hypothetical protein